MDGAESVKLFGEDISIKCEIGILPGKSGHADRDGLTDWLRGFETAPKLTFVNHGENTVTESFAEYIQSELGFKAMAPYSGTEFDLLAGKFVKITEGVPLSKPTVGGTKAESYYKSLQSAAQDLLALAKDSSGRPNKTLQAFIKDINVLIKKYK